MKVSPTMAGSEHRSRSWFFFGSLLNFVTLPSSERCLTLTEPILSKRGFVGSKYLLIGCLLFFDPCERKMKAF